MRNELILRGYDVRTLNDEQVVKLYKLLNDICFIMDDKTGSWYIATMCIDKMNDLRREMRLMQVKGVSLSQPIINKYLREGKFHLIKLKQEEYVRFKTFYCNASVPSRIPTLKGKTVYTLKEVDYNYRRVLSLLREGGVTLNGIDYIGYRGGIPMSGELLLVNKDGDVSKAQFIKIDSLEKYVPSNNIRYLLGGVCEYNGYKVTLNKDILEKFYGYTLYSKLESKGVRYRCAYYDILLNGYTDSSYYYKSKYGVEENFNYLSELMEILKNGMSEPTYNKCVARRLVSANTLLSGKCSLYITIPDNATLTPLNQTLNMYRVYGMNDSFGYVNVPCEATDVKTAISCARGKFRHDYGGETDILTVLLGDEVKEGISLYGGITYDELAYICQSISYGYTQNFDNYSVLIKSLAKKVGIEGVTDNHIKFLLINTIAKTCRKSSDVKFRLVATNLLRFFEYFREEVADDRLKSALRKICLSRLSNIYKSLDVNSVPDDGYKCEYGIIYKQGQKLSKMVDLYYEGMFVGKSVIS